MRTVLRNSKCIKIFLTLAFFFLISNSFATTYYSVLNGNPITLANWSTSPSGPGLTPPNFTTAGDIFIIQSTSTMDLNVNTKVWLIGQGVTLEIIGLLNITGKKAIVSILGKVIFKNASATQVSFPGVLNTTREFRMGVGSTLETNNVYGVVGLNCSLPLTTTLNLVTFVPGVNFVFTGTAPQNTLGLPATLVGDLKIVNNSGVTLSAPTSVGTLTIDGSSIFMDNGNQVLCTGAINFTGPGTYKLGSALSATTFPGSSYPSMGLYNTTVEYASGVSQIISDAPAYYDLIISGAGVKETPTSGGVTVGNNLTVESGSSFNVPSGSDISVFNAVINNAGAANFIINSNANLLQENSIAPNFGAITVKRNSNPLYRLDYTMWSSPVLGSQTLGNFSPLTNIDRFYTYSSSADSYSYVPPTTIFVPGSAYLIRMPNTDALTGYNAGTAMLTYPGTFIGTQNNGDIIVTTSGSLLNYYAMGNPYPSAIDANNFMFQNSEVAAINAIYYWRKKNGSTAGTYAVYTTLGGTASLGDPSSILPDSSIAVGQGFIVQTVNNTIGSIKFENANRVSDNTAVFLKTTTTERHRVWLNLTKPEGGVNQIMVGYMTNATSGIDAAIDGSYINDSQTALTSIINTQEYTIQGRALPFNASDVVALGFKTTTAGTFTIVIDHVDGLFANGQVIYLKDNLTNTTHNLTEGAYSFVSEAGVFNSRFEIVYQMALGTNDNVFDENNVVVYKNNGLITINSGILVIDNVKVFDISGRLLVEQSNIEASEAVINASKFANQVLLIQVTNNDGLQVTKKIIN